MNDPRLEIAYGSSLVDGSKINQIIQILQQLSVLDGDVAEVGVYRGGTANIICEYNKNSNVFLFDTFCGMPFFDEEKDREWIVGSFAQIDYNAILDIFKKYPFCFIYKGIFPQETSHNIIDKKFKFVHLDVDNYQSYKECLEFFYDRMITGGVIVFDDYDCDCCPGANIAVDEFFKDKPENIQKSNIIFVVKQ
jgi:O-methyltransferase